MVQSQKQRLSSPYVQVPAGKARAAGRPSANQAVRAQGVARPPHADCVTPADPSSQPTSCFPASIHGTSSKGSVVSTSPATDEPVCTDQAGSMDHSPAEDGLRPGAEPAQLESDGGLGMNPAAELLEELVQSVALDTQALTLDNTQLARQRPSTSASTTSLTTDKSLSQRRSYSTSGWLAQDEAVLAYMKKLEEHRKRCEQEGKYLEAKAASKRLAELRTSEAVRMRQAILDRQEHEIKLAEAAFAADITRLQQLWVQQLSQYDDSVDRQVTALQQKHVLERKAFICQMEERRPAKPRSSKDLLQQRRVVGLLAKQGLYSQAARVKSASDRMEMVEMSATLASFEAELSNRLTNLQAKQQQEVDVVTSKATRGREEMQRLHRQELARRRQRLRNLTAELTTLQRLEVVHLEHFMASQAAAGKQPPLRDSGFRRPTWDILQCT